MCDYNEMVTVRRKEIKARSALKSASSRRSLKVVLEVTTFPFNETKQWLIPIRTELMKVDQRIAVTAFGANIFVVVNKTGGYDTKTDLLRFPRTLKSANTKTAKQFVHDFSDVLWNEDVFFLKRSSMQIE